MKLLIFVLAILITGMESDSNSQIFIHSRTEVFIDKRTGEPFDRESMNQTFSISFEDSTLVRSIPDTKEQIRSSIKFIGQEKDNIIGEAVTQFRTLNPHTQQDEFYILWKRESGSYSLFQELPETNTRIFFDMDVRCIH